MAYPSDKTLWERLTNGALIRFLLFFACGWAFLQLLNYFETVIVVFISAAIVAFLLNYPVRSLERFLPRNIAVILIFLVSIIAIVAFTATVGLALLSQGQQLIDSITDFVNALAPLSQKLEAFLRERNLQVNLQKIEEQLRTQALAGVVFGVSFLQVFLTNLLNLVLILVVSFFMLLDGKRLWMLLLKFLPMHLQKRLTRIIKRNFLAFFQGQLILMSFLICSSFLVLLVLKVKFALILSVIIGIFDLIPGVGATLGIALVTLIVLSQNAWLALKVFLACIVLQQIQDNLIYPRIIQNSLNINPVVVFFALLIGAKAAGVLGIFIAIPLAGTLVTWFEIDEMKGESEVPLKGEVEPKYSP